MRPEMSEKIKAEVMKQFDAGFLAVTSYPQWVANVVPVPNKDGKVRMCVDYRDLNRASPKDDFPYRTLMSLLIIQLSIRFFLSWMVFQVIIRSRWLLKIWKRLLCYSVGHLLLQGYAFWVEEHCGNLSARHGRFVS